MTAAKIIRLLLLVSKSISEGPQKTHICCLHHSKNATITTFFLFSSEHHQSCLTSEVIYFRQGHKEVQRVKKEGRKDEEGKQTQTPVECLCSLTGPCK